MPQITQPNDSGAYIKNPRASPLSHPAQCVSLILSPPTHAAVDNKPRKQKGHPSKPSLLTPKPILFLLASILATRIKENVNSVKENTLF